MSAVSALSEPWRRRVEGWFSPFTAPVPEKVRDTLIMLQCERLRAFLPLLCLLVAANAVAMAMAVLGDLPWWQQFAPPTLIIGTCLAVLHHSRSGAAPIEPARGVRYLRSALLVAAALGLVAGLWAVNAFTETEKYYCMVAPVFIGIAALVSATCLLAVPRAAIAAMIATVLPVIIKMSLYDNLGVRAMAVMLLLVTTMQAGVVLGKFQEAVAMLSLQAELDRLAKSDSLTGLANRLALMDKLSVILSTGRPVLVALADLDGFKAANDTYGHLAGDAILVEVAKRMTMLAPTALCVARLGGDEFALLFDIAGGRDQADAEIAGIRVAIPLPFVYEQVLIGVGTSMGVATSPADGRDCLSLLARADVRLYADKVKRKKKQSLRVAS